MLRLFARWPASGRHSYGSGKSPDRSDHPRRLDHPRRGSEILDDAAARGVPRPRQEIQDRMVAIPGHLGDVAGAIAGALDCATQGVLPIAQGAAAARCGLHRRRACRREAGQLSLYWAVKEDCPIKTVADLKGKTVGISIIGGGTQGPFNLILKKGASIRRRTSSWSKSASRSPKVRSAAARSTPPTWSSLLRRGPSQRRHSQAVRARRGAAEHRAYRRGLPKRLRRPESRTWCACTSAISPRR